MTENFRQTARYYEGELRRIREATACDAATLRGFAATALKNRRDKRKRAKSKAVKVTPSCGCVFCDLGLHPNTAGFHESPGMFNLKCPVLDQPPMSGREKAAVNSQSTGERR